MGLFSLEGLSGENILRTQHGDGAYREAVQICVGKPNRLTGSNRRHTPADLNAKSVTVYWFH
jgi:hypothetical protein